MSFGLLKHFKDLKKGQAEHKQKSYVQNIIIGQDLGAVLKLLEVRKQRQGESVKLISTRPLNKQTLIEQYEYSVAQIRSQESVEAIFRKWHNVSLLPHSKDATFYKDGKFHEFSGRAKSMELLSGEDFFLGKGYRLKLASLFSDEEWENLDTIINECLDIRIFQSIEKVTSSELIEKQEWLLTFKDFAEMTCENLWVSMSPKKFLNLLANKEALTPELVDVCSSTKVQTALSVSLVLNKEIFNEERTLFIPQSMTHEWGHFIVEFETYQHEKKEQLCHVLFLIHEEEPQTEDMGGKIRLMKRVLDRVFPGIESAITKEYIRFDDEMFISEVKDSSLEQLGFDYPTLKFIGQMSHLPSSLTHEKYLARVLLN